MKPLGLKFCKKKMGETQLEKHSEYNSFLIVLLAHKLLWFSLLPLFFLQSCMRCGQMGGRINGSEDVEFVLLHSFDFRGEEVTLWLKN